MFALTRRRKIVILVSLIATLCIGALVSSFATDDSSHTASSKSKHGHHRSLKTRDGDRADSFGNLRTNTLHKRGHKKSTESGKSFIEPDALRRRGHKKNAHNEGSFLKGHKRQPKELKDTRQEGPVPTLSVKMAATTDEKFNAARVLHLFSSCRKDDDEIAIDCYNDGYEELCKLFKVFGGVFSFVTSDVVEKIGILRAYQKSPEADKYESVQSMLSYEVEKEITNTKKPSGSRTLLRLHRALEFVEELLVKIRDTDNNDKFSTVASKAYHDTLARHHPWLIRKAVQVAMYALPTRADLIKKMNLEDSENGMADLSKLIEELKVIYKITQDLYVKYDLLNLP